MQKTNIPETIKHLHDEMQKETQELRDLQEKFRVAQEDLLKKGQEVPRLRRQIEDDQHAMYVDKTDADKIKQEIARIQREKLVHQNALNQVQKAFQNDAKEHGKLTY